MKQDLLPNCWLTDVPVKGDERGRLVALEAQHEVPFDIARVYYIFDSEPNAPRGFHAHRNLQQYAVCVRGSLTMRLDNGREKRDVLLNRPDQALYIGSMVWREMHDLTPDCVLMVLADSLYDEADYIRDYDRFLELARGAGA
jgi:dTDP-4-dehydrorhamnose 3,5-epimerase-like enzyme